MVTKKIAPHHQRAVKLAGHHAKRVATTARYRHADRTGTADAAPWLVATQRDRGSTADRIDIANDERGGLSNLSTPELIDVVASELAARPEMHLVRNHVTALLAMAPTLTDRTQANRIGADVVDDAVEQAELETRARRHILDYPMLTAGQVAAVLRRPESDRTVASRLRTAGKVVALPVGNGYRYPEFQFDDATASVREVVATVNALLDAGADPWGGASWGLTPSTRLPKGHTPADLALDPDPAAHRKLERLASAVLAD